MINTKEMTRKCPGRLFSVIEQAILFLEMYKNYTVILDGGNLDLAKKKFNATSCKFRVNYNQKKIAF
ncbi:hypothetical protein C6H68_10685 [Photorhabdus luminescens]|nr:hypothetical protein C6H68_10685 [Photorhabdus luminescens]